MNSFFNKKIPTIAGLLLLAVAVLTTSYLVNTGVILFGGAAPSENPEDIRITNVSDTGFSVTYKTEAKVIGTISLDDNGKTHVVLDERDQKSGVPNQYSLHSITMKSAKPQTAYQFTITSGTTVYQNNGNPFSVTTAPALTASPSAVAPLSGKLLDPSGTAPQEALIFATTAGGQSLSAVADANGVYILPLNALRTTSFSDFLMLSNSSVIQILATNGTSATQAQVLLSAANPVPLMTLGNNYNFISSTAPIASTAASLGFPSFPNSNLAATPVIITPKKDQSFTDSQPQFRGTALPNQPVTIEIHSSAVVSAIVTTDAFGNWTYRPQTPLSPGQHVLSITTKNASGILQTIQQSFTVFASGSQVAQSATPSGQILPPATPTPTKTVLPTGSILSPTSVPTLQPSPTPTPAGSIGAKLTPKPTLPPTGSNAMIATSVLGIVTTLVGVVLFVLTKGASL